MRAKHAKHASVTVTLSNRPVQSLILFFALWKIFLLVLAYSSPGAGYDTSTTLLDIDFRGINANPIDKHFHFPSFRVPSLAEKLTRWDAIYFTQIARRDYVYEQEWAFGWGYTRFLWFLTQVNERFGFGALAVSDIAIIAANVSHLLAVLLSYRISDILFRGVYKPNFSFIVSCLHIISPAGLFLSAPYAESLFSCLSFCGYFFYMKSFQYDHGGNLFKRDSSLLLAGAAFGLATSVRNNGLLHGILFVYTVVESAFSLYWNGVRFAGLRTVATSILAGIMNGFGFVYPQYLAYIEYCGQNTEQQISNPRQWCSRTVPSIYGWVQDRYWNVGLLRYWTLSNVPLFLLASPTICILVLSSYWSIRGYFKVPWKRAGIDSICAEASGNPIIHLVGVFAVPQLVLTLLALFTYHVQIITRLSSGYMVWYWWIASLICKDSTASPTDSWRTFSRVATRWMVVYAIIQGGLFASFLPPA